MSYEVNEFENLSILKEPLVYAFELPIHRQIKVKRIYDGFNQTELASILGMGVSTLSEIENGRRRIPYKYRNKVESYLYHELYWEKAFRGYVDNHEKDDYV